MYISDRRSESSRRISLGFKGGTLNKCLPRDMTSFCCHQCMYHYMSQLSFDSQDPNFRRISLVAVQLQLSTSNSVPNSFLLLISKISKSDRHCQMVQTGSRFKWWFTQGLQSTDHWILHPSMDLSDFDEVFSQ